MEQCFNPFSLEGKRILITGASSGIGRAIAVTASRLGAEIIAVARGEERLQALMAELGPAGEHSYIAADVTDQDALEGIVADVPGLDGLAICAGKGLTLPVQFSDRKNFDEIFNVNFFSAAELTRLLYKKKKLNKGASVVLMASMGGTHVFSGGNSIYGASKAALNSFMKFSAKEFAPRKVRVNSICPGMVDTPLIHRGTVSEEQLRENAKLYPLKRYGQPEDVANAAIYLLSDAAAWVTGTEMIVDGGLNLI